MSRRRFAAVRSEVWPCGTVWCFRVRWAFGPDHGGTYATLADARRAAKAVAARLRREWRRRCFPSPGATS